MSTIPAPRVRPAAAVASSVIALLLVAVAVVAVRDLAVAQGWTKGTTWTSEVLDRLDGLSASGGVLVAGIVLVAIGLWWVVLAVAPAARSHHATQLATDVWISSAALSASAANAAEGVSGVASAEATVRRRRIAVTVQTDRTDIAPDVETAVTRHLAGFSDRTVTVTTEKVKHDA